MAAWLLIYLALHQTEYASHSAATLWIPTVISPLLSLVSWRVWLVPAALTTATQFEAMRSIPTLALWTGVPVVGIWCLSGLTALAARSPMGWQADSGPALPILLAAIWIGGIAWAASGLPPTGDEPHYLMIATSLARDGDVATENNYLDRQYLEFYPGELGPYGSLAHWHLLLRPNNQVVSVHGPGLPLLVLPGFMLGGVAGARLVVLCVVAVASGLFWSTCRRIGSPIGAWMAWAALVFSVPFAIFGSRLYPDGPAIGAVICGLWLLVAYRRGSRPRDVVVFVGGGALASLPWLHIRLAIPACILGVAIIHTLWRREKRPDLVALFLALPFGSATWLLAWTWVTAGTLDPAFPFSGSLRPEWLTGGIFGLTVDQEFGVLIYAPVYFVTPFALLAMRRTIGQVTLTVGALAIAVVWLAASFVWWAGYSPPARFLAPILPAFALGIAAWWPTASPISRRLTSHAVTFGALVAVAISMVGRGRNMINNADGQANLLAWLSDVVDLPAAFPSLFPPGPLPLVELEVIGVWAASGLGALALLRALSARRADRIDEWAVILAMALWISVASTLAWAVRGASPWLAPQRNPVAGGFNGSELFPLSTKYQKPNHPLPGVALHERDQPLGILRLRHIQNSA